MEEFRVIQPSPALAPYVKNYWLLKTDGNSDVARTVPTGMMNLIFHRGRRLFSLGEGVWQPRVFLSGQERTFADLQYDGQVDMISVVFRPTGVRAFFDLPVNEIAGLRIEAGDIGDRDFAALGASVTCAENDDICIFLIERFLFLRLKKYAEYNCKRIEVVIDLINSGENNIDILADAACLSVRQLGRVFSEYVGINPKQFSRTVRFQKALDILENSPEISFSALAADCGYFDQSHMIREFKTFSGYSPGQYLAICLPHSDYFGK